MSLRARAVLATGLSLVLAVPLGTPAGAADDTEATGPSVDAGAEAGTSDGHRSALSDEPLPLQVERAIARPRPLLELGAPFLGTGKISGGFGLPTGAWWQPTFLVFGQLRSAFQAFDRANVSGQRSVEWANRVDVFGELKVSQTERVLVGFRAFDDHGRFSGRRWDPDRSQGWVNGFNADVEVAFFEGNFGELFPALDTDESRALDVEFSVGRQPLLFQDGFLLNDVIDAVAITRNNINLPFTTNTRVAAIYGWNDVGRADNLEDRDAKLYALLFETDTPRSTLNLDFAWVASSRAGGSLFAGGLSGIQRIGHWNTVFRVMVSRDLDSNTPRASSGKLLYAEASWTPPYTHDNLYVNAFWGIDQFDSAARGPATGGPLGTTGILFGSVGMGSYGAPLGSSPDDSVGAALGYQKFMDHQRRQIVLELGARQDTNGVSASAIAGGVRLQQAIGRRVVLRLDGFVSHTEGLDTGWGSRVEILIKF